MNLVWLTTCIIAFLWTASCRSNKQKDAPFMTNDEKLLEEYADKALEEANHKLDSLWDTPLLDTSYFIAPQ